MQFIAEASREEQFPLPASISNTRMLFSHKLLSEVSNFDQTCERYRTDPQCAPEYKTSRHEITRDASVANPGKFYG